MCLKIDSDVWIQIRISFIAYIGQILVGYALGWTAPVFPKLIDEAQTPLPEVLTLSQASWIGSVLYVGTIIGPYITSYISNKNGRRPCFFLGATVSMLGFLVLALAQNLAMIFAGRILQGLAVGVVFVTNLVYIGEIASTKLRGILLTGIGIFATLGTLIVYAIGPFVRYTVVNWIGFGISAVYFIGLLSMPESPLFFVLKGNQEKAKQTLRYLGRANEKDVLNTKVDPNDAAWKDLFTIRSNRKALTITVVLNILQQLSGVIAILFFATSIFEMAGSSISPGLSTILIGITQLLASIAAPIFVERSGRRFLLMVSTAFCGLSLAVCGVFMYLDTYYWEAARKVTWLPLVTLIIYFLSYDLGFGVIPGTLIGEMFQSNVRSTGSALTITAGWLFGFGVSSAFGYMIDGLGSYSTFWIYSGACALAFLFTLLCVPETKGKSLEEIQDILSGHRLKR